MNSFKKISIASATALALVVSAVMAVPATAAVTAAVTVGVTDVATSSQVSTTPATPTVPSDNKVDLGDTVKFVVTVATGTVVRATATDAKLVTALDAAGAEVPASAGAASLEINTGSGTTATFYAFTTKTTAGSVVVTAGGSSSTYYLKGLAGPAYNLSVAVPTVAGLGSDVDFTANVTDVFGNAVVDATITTSLLRGTVKTALAYDSADKRYEGVITTPATAGAVAGIATISATDVTGLAKAVNEASFTIAAADLATQVATLQSLVVTLESKVANRVTKKRFNKLARKWNAANPSEKVKLKK